MSKLKDALSNVRELLKDVVTADNTDAVAKITKALDDADTEGKSIEAEIISLKDKIVDMVKGTLSTQKDSSHKDDIEDGTEKSLDDIMKEEADKIISRRK